MPSETTFHAKRASAAVATVATLTMLAAAVALLVLASYPRNVAGQPLRLSLGTPLWLAVGGGVCWLSVRYRLVWFIAVPLVVTIASTATSLSIVTKIGLYTVLVTSLTLVLGKKYLEPAQGRLTAPFLAACSGWSSAFAILAALSAADRQSGAWSAPLLLAGVAAILGLRARALTPNDAAAEAQTAGKLNGRAYWRGFFTCFGTLVVLVGAAIIVHLPYGGANSGSAAPGAWQPR